LTREAQSTSALEGTYAPIAELLAADAEDEGAPVSATVREVLNYMSAAELAFSRVADGQPISVAMLRELHAALVTGTKADTIDTGRIRTIPVVIGSPGSALEDARFIPPPPGLELESAVSDLVDWMNASDQDRDPVAAAAIAHYQFETLHPFNDGNGRIGRLLVVIQLMCAQRLGEPLLSISPWFENRRQMYADRLAEVSATGDWDGWIAFFARGLAASAEDTAKRVDQLLDVQADYRAILRKNSVRGVITEVADNLIGYPFVRVAREARRTGKTAQAIYTVVARLIDLGILVPASQLATYDRMFVAPRVMEILQAPSA
jgi:Fic family protein